MSQKKEAEAQREAYETEIRRTKMPRGREVFGIVEQRLGGTRMYVRCLDRKRRLCRVPGRFKRRLWIREGDTVLVEPWELSGETRGDLIYKYSKAQVQFMKNRGILKQLQEFEEF
jgi:translation initiation factor 1A